MLLGVNLSGGEFNPSGTRLNWDYTYPTTAEIDYYASKGLSVIRLPKPEGKPSFNIKLQQA